MSSSSQGREEQRGREMMGTGCLGWPGLSMGGFERWVSQMGEGQTVHPCRPGLGGGPGCSSASAQGRGRGAQRGKWVSVPWTGTCLAGLEPSRCRVFPSGTDSTCCSGSPRWVLSGPGPAVRHGRGYTDRTPSTCSVPRRVISDPHLKASRGRGVQAKLTSCLT